MPTRCSEAWATTQHHCKSHQGLEIRQGRRVPEPKRSISTCKRQATARKLTTHDTPQLNGIAEKAMLNRTLLGAYPCLHAHKWPPQIVMGRGPKTGDLAEELDSAPCPRWQDAFRGSLYGRPPSLSALRTWGTPVLEPPARGSKLNVRAREARMART